MYLILRMRNLFTDTCSSWAERQLHSQWATDTSTALRSCSYNPAQWIRVIVMMAIELKPLSRQETDAEVLLFAPHVI